LFLPVIVRNFARMDTADHFEKLKRRLEALGELPRELGEVELRMKIPVPLAGAINNMHGTTFERTYPNLVQRIAKRRKGVALGDALDPQPRPSPSEK
jgi:hypothetical protein